MFSQEKERLNTLALTPVLATSKIPILSLITGYCYKKLPSKSISPVLSTLVRLIENHSESKNKDTDLISSFFPSLNEILKFVADSIVNFFDETTNPRPKEEIQTDIDLVHEYILGTLWGIISLDQFHDFLSASNRLLVDSSSHRRQETGMIGSSPVKSLTSSSFLGRFVSNISMASDVMMFDETIVLWKTFLSYREESKERWDQLNKGNSGTFSTGLREHDNQIDLQLQNKILSKSGLLTDLTQPETKIQAISQVDLAQMLEYQVQMLQKYASPAPKSMKNILKLMSESQRGIIPSAYYIEYLECWKQGDYEGSFNALHRYFDYMMSNRQQLFYHYALLSLATLHASFGSDDEALRAIDEAILVARENKDLDCLNYLLTWLFNFLKDKPHLYSKVNNQTTRHQILQFLKLKTKENKNWILQSMAYQYQALQFMLDGAPLQKILENITRASYILLNFDVGADIGTTFVRNCQLSVAAWNRVGVPALSKLYIDVALESCGSSISIFDEVAIKMRQSIIKYQEGEIDEAFELFQAYEDLISDDISLLKIWQSRFMLLKVDLWMNKCRFKPVSILLSKLVSQIEDINDQDLYYEVNFKRANYEFHMGNNTTAVQIIADNLSNLKKNENSYNHSWFIEFQILYASIITKSSSAPERSLSILLNSLTLAHNSLSLTLIVKGSLTLCELLLSVDSQGSADDVEQIIYKIMPLAGQINNLWLTSYGYFFLSRVLFIKLVSYSESIDEFKLKQKFNKILEYLELAVVGFKKMNDLKMMKATFEIEKELAEFSSHEDLIHHSNQAIKQLDVRIYEESLYSIC